ncbi:hypothetical protein O3P69_010161 [Scylla paramamosain]|uniref:Reverse transcriptase domain-containing protein n=1 Tax=Scylla paramamosain TaxID=85552 RepID=A0AAW0TSJ8_SCYPA
MDKVMRDPDFVVVYIDDILVSSSSPQQHMEHLRQVLLHLQDHGLKIHPTKCNQTPGDLLKGVKKHSPLEWGLSADEAFRAIKRQLLALTRLEYPVPHAKTVLATDASAEAVGAVLQQEVADELLPVAFFNKRLEPAQSNYSVFDRELLAVYEAVRHFRYFLEDREFHLLTDHKPLTHAMVQSGNSFTPRVCRQLAFISEFTKDIRHVRGEENPWVHVPPHANGILEQFHQRLKEAMRALPHPASWVEALPIILLTLSATEEDIHHTPAEPVYGKDLRLPGQFVAPGGRRPLPVLLTGSPARNG